MDEFRNRIRRVDDMLAGLDGLLEPAARGRIQELVGFLLDIHGEGLRRILERLSSEGPPGRSLLGDVARDEVVGGLLLLHGLHPQDLETRIREALDRVRPQLASHGGNVELVDVDEQGVLRLRLEGACHGCPSSAATLRTTIEDAVHAAAPEVTELVLDTSARSATEAVS
jgi:Fe-S cluster biogenesis protein NfuA